jgi:Malate synthase
MSRHIWLILKVLSWVIETNPDSQCPQWTQMLTGQVNLRDAVLKKVDFKAANGKEYKLRTDKKLPTLIVRSSRSTSILTIVPEDGI